MYSDPVPLLMGILILISCLISLRLGISELDTHSEHYML